LTRSVTTGIIWKAQPKLPKLTARLHNKSGGFYFGGKMTLLASLFAAGTLAIASGAQNDSSEDQNGGTQVILDGSFELNIDADKALPFFTPEGERTWVDGWDPEPVYPAQKDVAFQTNAVFRLSGDGSQSIWTILEANLKDHIAEYVYVVEGERVSRVRVQVEPLTASQCRVHVRYVHTAISEKGSHFIAALTEAAYAQKMRDWQRTVTAAVR